MSKKLLFDQFLLVSLKEDKDGANGNSTIIPYVKDVYPPDSVDPNVPLFCFPEEIDRSYIQFNGNKLADSMFTFVLTDREGRQQFGFTKRIITSTNGNKILECLCIISHHAWSSTFGSMLEILETRYRVSIEEIHNFLAASLLSVIPAPGDSFTVYIYDNPFLSAKSSNLPVSYTLKRPVSTDKSSLHDGTLQPLIETLSSQKILYLFISLLFERRVIIYSENITRVSKFINAIVSLLDPFSWQHIFIPILPRTLLDYCTAPMPFIIGIHSSLFAPIRRKPLNEIVFVDLDKDSVLPLPEDIAIFPAVLLQPLKQCLDIQMMDWKKNKHYDNRNIVDTFRRFFVTILGTYRRFFLKDMDKKKMIFDKVSFIDSQLITPTKFFTVFCASQMFERFIAEREEYYFQGVTPPGVFEKDVIIYDLKHPVTASINNTLRNKEKEKEKEKEREKQLKQQQLKEKQERLERQQQLLQQHQQSLTVVKSPVNSAVNSSKFNGSVDRSFLASLMGINNNNNNQQQPSQPSQQQPQQPINKAKTVTIADLQKQQQPPQSPQHSNLLTTALSVQKSNLASLANGILNAASITKSQSSSFTLGSPSMNSDNNKSTLKTSVSHHKSLSDLANNNNPVQQFSQQLQQQQQQHNQTTSSNLNSSNSALNTVERKLIQQSESVSKLPSLVLNGLTKSRSSSSAASTGMSNSASGVLKSARPLRSFIPMKSVPFNLLHQKFSPEDKHRLVVEDLYEFLYPQSPTVPHKIIISQPTNGRKEGTYSSPSVPTCKPSSITITNASMLTLNNQNYIPTNSEFEALKKSMSVDKNLFKIPEAPNQFSIPLPISKKSSLNNSNNSLNNSSGSLNNSGSNIINNNLDNSNGLKIMPPPASPNPVSHHQHLPHLHHHRGHHRSYSTANPIVRTSSLLGSSFDPNQSSNDTTNHSEFPQATPSQVQEVLNTNLKHSTSLPKVSHPVKLSESSNNPLPNFITSNTPNESSNNTINSTDYFNPLPPLSSTIGSVSSAINVSGSSPMPPIISTPTGSITNSNNNTASSGSSFFSNNPLETHIATSPLPAPTATAEKSSSGSKFFSDGWPLGEPTLTPQINQDIQQQLNQQQSQLPAMVNQSGEFFSPFVSHVTSQSPAPTQQNINNNNNNNININNSSNNITNNTNTSTCSSFSSTSSVLPPLLNSSSIIPPPSYHSSNFFDQSPLSQSNNFNDFGPPTPSYHINSSTSNPGTFIQQQNNNSSNNNPLPPLNTSVNNINQSSNKTVINENDLDEFDLFVSLRNKNKN
ncbi:hypothetical protein DICPUDRAFT_77109 [Dictyostelium purpureum]|uniref:UDENN domain-containing protein n=1 Tax=Dictyostelium purpureum TaxID=5786 RepID=F0ZFM2_DICPU|nr:uncharacterized protein DICPUDRAFT_77109 [Dictyostelium purpureum]EGC37255.1 hypothetical protein DICPUDRAFT_77109 [Dictyostelium purpureum]|eukprot:XP_003286225.1 hypothetical protein DICPUDRAFT_77109 [Dictyostelium purpureum]